MRERNEIRLQVYMPESMYGALETAAAHNAVSCSSLVRMLIANYLTQAGAPRPAAGHQHQQAAE